MNIQSSRSRSVLSARLTTTTPGIINPMKLGILTGLLTIPSDANQLATRTVTFSAGATHTLYWRDFSIDAEGVAYNDVDGVAIGIETLYAYAAIVAAVDGAGAEVLVQTNHYLHNVNDHMFNHVAAGRSTHAGASDYGTVCVDSGVGCQIRFVAIGKDS